MNDKLLNEITVLTALIKEYSHKHIRFNPDGWIFERMKDIMVILEQMRDEQIESRRMYAGYISKDGDQSEQIEYKQNPDNSREWIPKTEIKEVETEKEIGKSEFICPKCNKPITYISVTVGERVEQYIAYQDGNCKCVGPPPFSLEYINYIKRERIKNEEDKGGGNAS